MSIKENLSSILSTLPKPVTLVAVSKTKPIPENAKRYRMAYDWSSSTE